MARKEFPLSFVESQIRIEKQAKEDYYKKNPDSLILSFERELADMGFTFETSSQTLALMPRCKEWLLPIIVSYYNRAKQEKRYNEQNHFLGFFCHKGLDEVIPMLIKDFWSSDTPDLTKWFISDCIYSIQSKSFVNDYMEIILWLPLIIWRFSKYSSRFRFFDIQRSKTTRIESVFRGKPSQTQSILPSFCGITRKRAQLSCG